MSQISSIDAVRSSNAFQKLSPADRAEVTAVLQQATSEQMAAYFGRGVDRDELQALLSDKTVQAQASNPHFTPRPVPPRPMFATMTADVVCKTEWIHQIDSDISEVVQQPRSPSDTPMYNCDKGSIRSTVKDSIQAQTGRRVKAVFGADMAARDALGRGLTDGDGTLRLPVRVVFAR